MRNLNVILLGMIVLMAVQARAQQAIVSIDFNATSDHEGNAVSGDTYSGSEETVGGLTPYPGQSGAWNVLELGQSLTELSEPIALSDAVDGRGEVTGIGFALNANSQVITCYDGPGGPDLLGRDFVFVQSNAVVDWGFTGLTADATYAIRFFGQVDGRDPHHFAIIKTAGGTPGTVQATALQNHVDITAVADENGSISGTFQRNEHVDPVTPGSISGVQIVAMPDPASMTMSGMGVLWILNLCAGRRQARRHPRRNNG